DDHLHRIADDLVVEHRSSWVGSADRVVLLTGYPAHCPMCVRQV
ncbi:MAG: hypothetical protein JWL64_93, partial [Frankiales bacterium]|nr:hypothetical protein [Frankiales bacterium]